MRSDNGSAHIVLCLSSNQLTGSIPGELGQLGALDGSRAPVGDCHTAGEAHCYSISVYKKLPQPVVWSEVLGAQGKVLTLTGRGLCLTTHLLLYSSGVKPSAFDILVPLYLLPRVCRVIKRVSDSQGVWWLSQSLKLACVLGKALMSSDSEDEDISPTAGFARAQMRLLIVVMDSIIKGDYVEEPPAGFRPSALSRYATIFAKQSGSSRKKRLAALYPLLAAMVPKLDGAADMRMDDEGALEAFIHDNPRTDHIVIQCAMTGDKDSDESINLAISYACALIAHWEVQQLLPANAERPCAALLCTQFGLHDCVIQTVVEEQLSSSDSDCSDEDDGTYRIRPLVHIENTGSCAPCFGHASREQQARREQRRCTD